MLTPCANHLNWTKTLAPKSSALMLVGLVSSDTMQVFHDTISLGSPADDLCRGTRAGLLEDLMS